MNAKRALAQTASAAVAVSTLWLLAVSYELSGLLLPSGARFVVAHDGAEVAFRDGVLHVLRGEAGLVGSVVPASAAVAASVLVALAIVGCRSLLRRSAASPAL